ncbi:type IV toxin-antitoxin system AbiEi family antitoxin [Reichenbachiella ulvae]|uniref:Type IV toxin-antitoxin system AbiEi family antitoxin n=1 Tax=Reichenbachiella ulvae TaxID=2980104 RepID=A0ABT3CWJ0_9BACT|nr:type IV toxin-antitoxin system AbiEi family antitoxin [Reichenbachiella ulvae]MCV9388077.1 type IV toxin-antitoxin system AbiEi family antitoxin [Reichenbachiella ulvae]
MNERIIHIAIKNVEENLPIKLEYREAGQPDGNICLTHKDQTYHLHAVIKGGVRKYVLDQLAEYVQEYQHVILVAEHIPAKVKQQLREQHIPYIEANGNIYFENNNTFLLVDTNKTKAFPKEKGNRAFTKTGLKVLFHLLQKPELIKFPQRQIADVTGVALGNIPQVIEGLKKTGYLLPLNDKEYLWNNREELLDRWIEAYQTTLKPSLKKGNYQPRIPWKQIGLNTGRTVWSGEPAGENLTMHLRAEKLQMYTRENQADLIKNYQLQPKTDGEIEVYDMFWEEEFNQSPFTAPPLIVYADLIIEGGKRNKETAKLIFDEFIEPIL